MHVGLLEDDVAIQEMLHLILVDEGYKVTDFSDPHLFLEELGVTKAVNTSLELDLLIVDWRLSSSLSGIEVITHLRHHPRFQKLPIILMTAAAYVDTEQLQTLHVVLMEKPFAVDDMTDLVKRVTQPISPS